MHKKVCLEFHIGQCLGPCEGKAGKEEYWEVVSELQKFLEGRKGDLIDELKAKMQKYSRQEKFEKAIAIKQRLKALSDIQRFHDRSKVPLYGELEELKAALDLPKVPVNIECFDISNLKGLQAVGSMVRFSSGKPDKNHYRRFKIKSVLFPDDYAMIREVVGRRYARLIKEDKKLPDLVLIDGGKGHLAAALKELEKVGIDVPAASIAKEYNHIYVPHRKRPVRMAPGTRALLLIQRVRDEAHRFAIEYHRKLRQKDKFNTSLRNIRGVGPKKEKMLLEKMESIKKIRKASADRLVKAGLDRPTAEKVEKYYKKQAEQK